MVLTRIFLTDMAKVSGAVHKKIVVIGLTRLLCECPLMLDPTYIGTWPQVIQGLIELFELPPDKNEMEGDQYEQADAEGYEAAFSQLSFALPKVHDPCAHIADSRKFLVENLAKWSKSVGADVVARMIATLPADHQQALQKYCAQAGVIIA